MSKNKLIFWSTFVGFVGLTVSALWNELSRNATKLEYSISGVILSANGVGGGIVKTDNAHVLLFDPKTLELVASQIINRETYLSRILRRRSNIMFSSKNIKLSMIFI